MITMEAIIIITMLFCSNRVMNLLTFPGIILRQIAHRYACDILGIPVYEICYFKPLEKISGYVVHEKVTNGYQSFVIIMVPFFINSIICTLMLFPCFLPFALNIPFVDEFESRSIINTLIYLLLIWIGFSAGYNALPNNIDIQDAQKSSKNPIYYSFLSFVEFIVIFLNIQFIGPMLKSMSANRIGLFLAYMFSKIIT